MHTRLTTILVMAIALAGISGCKIIRDGDSTAANGAFDAKTYVAGIWDSKVVPLFRDKPTDVGAILKAISADSEAAGKQYGHRPGEGQPWTYILAGEGKIKSIDTASRHGTMIVELEGTEQPAEVVIQIGPVVFGTALRDSLPFLSFGDFVNQIDFAEVSRALNDSAIAAARGSVDLKNATGAKVTFAGAANAPSGGAPMNVTPVILSIDRSGT